MNAMNVQMQIIFFFFNQSVTSKNHKNTNLFIILKHSWPCHTPHNWVAHQKNKHNREKRREKKKEKKNREAKKLLYYYQVKTMS